MWGTSASGFCGPFIVVECYLGTIVGLGCCGIRLLVRVRGCMLAHTLQDISLTRNYSSTLEPQVLLNPLVLVNGLCAFGMVGSYCVSLGTFRPLICLIYSMGDVVCLIGAGQWC